MTDVKFITSSPMGKGTKIDSGKSVRLQVDGIDIIVCSVRNQVFDEQIFVLHGIDIRQMKIVALKSSIHFRAAFEALSDHIITVDSAGLSMINFTEFSYQRVRRPIYPLDADVE
ncbi:MlrC C-terminal domain-containing protein [Paenibacillus eucommiae]|uniref:Microcystin degradation protein MlrC n=1 Tax=Paenibacillus eucommiae TaxID=1355755 RepID=A0ABS4ILT1_9BACL|nr:MlrC C-terminal domain-containing protein [Paenibacillus eucommiae]MBP1988538.1 microcystin degradation protein MlrC [Paenibacillus eucommiae]